MPAISGDVNDQQPDSIAISQGSFEHSSSRAQDITVGTHEHFANQPGRASSARCLVARETVMATKTNNSKKARGNSPTGVDQATPAPFLPVAEEKRDIGDQLHLVASDGQPVLTTNHGMRAGIGRQAHDGYEGPFLSGRGRHCTGASDRHATSFAGKLRLCGNTLIKAMLLHCTISFHLQSLSGTPTLGRS